MAWLKLDDQFFRNPKVIDAGRDARDLYLAGLCYCGAGLTDGRIPNGALRMLGAEADIDDVREAADALVRVGLWERRDDGYTVHDYLEYNPSKERVIATRAVRSEAGSRGGKQRASNLLEPEQTFATENLQAKSNPVPVPYPSRPTPDPEPVPRDANDAPAAPVVEPPPVRAKPRKRIPDDWALTDELREYAVDHGIPAYQVDELAAEFKRYWQGDGRPKADWDLTFMTRVRDQAGRYAPRASPASNGHRESAAAVFARMAMEDG